MDQLVCIACHASYVGYRISPDITYHTSELQLTSCELQLVLHATLGRLSGRSLITLCTSSWVNLRRGMRAPRDSGQKYTSRGMAVSHLAKEMDDFSTERCTSPKRNVEKVLSKAHLCHQAMRGLRTIPDSAP